MKLEYKRMGLSEEQVTRFIAMRDLLEKTIGRYEQLAHELMCHCCPHCEFQSMALVYVGKMLIVHGGDAVSLKKTTFVELERTFSTHIQVLERIIEERKPDITRATAHKALDSDKDLQATMQAPSFLN